MLVFRRTRTYRYPAPDELISSLSFRRKGYACTLLSPIHRFVKFHSVTLSTAKIHMTRGLPLGSIADKAERGRNRYPP